MMVLIDAAWKELSNAGLIVNLAHFDRYFVISNGRSIERLLCSHFLTPFLTGAICKKSIFDAHYTCNR